MVGLFYFKSINMSYKDKLVKMEKIGKNIPFTQEEVRSCPKGFTATAMFFTKRFEHISSKFIRIAKNSIYHQKRNIA